MSSSEVIERPREGVETRARAKPRLLGRALFVLWVSGVLAVFLAMNAALVAPIAGFAMKLALATGSAWMFHFTGWRVLRRWRARLSDGPDALEWTVYELAVGVGVIVAATLALGVLGLYSTWSLAAVAVVAIAADPRAYACELRTLLVAPRDGSRFLLVTLALVGALTLLESFAPATSQDALVYHLAIPQAYLRAGGIEYLPGNFFASFPQNVEMLFTFALGVGGESLAKFCHWLLGAGSALAVAALARRVTAGAGIAVGGGMIAAAIVATVPTVALIATWAYVDLGVVFFQVTAILAFLRWWRASNAGAWLALAAVFTGLAAGCKYTGGSIGILLGCAIFVAAALEKQRFGRAFVRFTGFGALSLLVASPWYVKNLVHTGNPIHPFLYVLFGGRDWDSDRGYMLSKFLREWGGGESLLDVVALPLKLTFSSEFFSIESYDGLVGPIFLLALPLAFSATRRGERFWFVGMITVGLALIWLGTTRQIRFLLPALACAAALIGACLHLQPSGWPRRVARSCIALALVFNALVISTHFAAHDPIPVVFGYESEHDYRDREIPGRDYAVFRFIDEELPESSRILFGASGNPVFLCKRDYRMSPIFENEPLVELLSKGSTPVAVRDAFREAGFTHVLFRGDLVFDPSRRRSDLTLEQQLLFQRTLNEYGRLVVQKSGTFLYSVGESKRSDEGGDE